MSYTAVITPRDGSFLSDAQVHQLQAQVARKPIPFTFNHRRAREVISQARDKLKELPQKLEFEVLRATDWHKLMSEASQKSDLRAPLGTVTKIEEIDGEWCAHIESKFPITNHLIKSGLFPGVSLTTVENDGGILATELTLTEEPAQKSCYIRGAPRPFIMSEAQKAPVPEAPVSNDELKEAPIEQEKASAPTPIRNEKGQFVKKEAVPAKETKKEEVDKATSDFVRGIASIEDPEVRALIENGMKDLISRVNDERTSKSELEKEKDALVKELEQYKTITDTQGKIGADMLVETLANLGRMISSDGKGFGLTEEDHSNLKHAAASDPKMMSTLGNMNRMLVECNSRIEQGNRKRALDDDEIVRNPLYNAMRSLSNPSTTSSSSSSSKRSRVEVDPDFIEDLARVMYPGGH